MEAYSEEKLRETITLIYPELKRIALSKLKKERNDHTLEAAALANEALLRILRREREGIDPHQLVLEALLDMRTILIDYARRRRIRPENFTDPVQYEEISKPQLRGKSLELRAKVELLLGELQTIDERAAHVVRLLYFLGLSQEEAGLFLGISTRMVQRDWKFAREWLRVNWW